MVGGSLPSYRKEMTDAIRSRYGGSKKRSGCITCKSRHVKCDERKPRCLRCEKVGRSCEGYRRPTARNNHDQLVVVNYVPTPSGRLSVQPAAAPQEQRALSFFQQKTAPEIAGNFSSEFWSRFMLLVAYHQTSVKHALIALGSVHEAFVKAEHPTEPLASDSALQHYGRAIRQVLAIRDAKSQEAVEVALISCILFACLESLRGYYQSAITHLQSGMKVLEEEQTGPPYGRHTHMPRAMLRSLFVRMDSQIMNVGALPNAAGISLARNVQVSVPRCYLTVDDALNEFEILYNHSIHVMCHAEQVATDPSALATTLEELRQQMSRLEALRVQWQEAFDAMLLSDIPGVRPRDPPCLILNIYNNILRIMIQVDLLDPECDFDRFVDVFRDTVDDAEEVIFKTSIITPSRGPTRSPSPSTYSFLADDTLLTASRSSSFPLSSADTPQPTDAATPPLVPRLPPRITPNFSLTMGVVGALYFAAARCRSGPVRHKALSLLKMCNRRDGLWDSRLAAGIAEQLIAIEESNLQASLPPKTTDAVTRYQMGQEDLGQTYGQIPEHMRVRTVDVTFGPDDSGRAAYSFMSTVDVHTCMDRGSGQPFHELMRW